MFNKNDGTSQNEKLQNQFTAYLKKAVHNRRLRYLLEESRRQTRETAQDDLEMYFSEDTDFIQELADYEAVQQALRQIKERERHIVVARVIEEKGFAEIAAEQNMSYKAVTALYYRALKRLKMYLDSGGDW